jgi:hypothetical protein
MKSINLEELKQQIPHDNIQWAYCKLDDARKKLNEACKTHAPEPPLKAGDQILYDVGCTGKVVSVAYKPYALHKTFAKWDIIIDPGSKGHEENYIGLSDEIHTNVKLINC